jgi:hypothetical protein
MIRCSNCGLVFSLFTETGFEMTFANSEDLRKMFRQCGHCDAGSESLEWVPGRSHVADALSFAYECSLGVEQ